MQMQGHPDAANMSNKSFEKGDLIRGSSNVLRGGLNALDIAVSDAEDGGVPEVKIANLQGDLRGSVQSKSSEDLGKGGGFDEDVVVGCKDEDEFCFSQKCCEGMTCNVAFKCKADEAEDECQENVGGTCNFLKFCTTPNPTASPSDSPTPNPTASPSDSPTLSPTANPTTSPSDSPSKSPTKSPSSSPSISPTASPSDSPTLSPIANPTASPTDSPTRSPTANPTDSPTQSPTDSPSDSPSKSPTKSPSLSPSISPTASPSDSPSKSPTESPTPSPTESPTQSPTANPTASPTASPTPSPTESPTPSPTDSPTASPTPSPTSICTITQEYSDGTGGNWELISSIGTDPSEVTTLENLDEFVISADEVVNVVGTLVVYANTIIINGTLDGSGGGYAGANASYTERYEYAPDGERPACDLDEIGECKSDSTIDGNGKGGREYGESVNQI
eukprot:scaffold7022_cov36-Cyclotella_meneghiniana.AAC.1